MSHEFTYVSCPYCSHQIELSKFKRATFPIDPLDFYILTVREQRSGEGFRKGRGKGHRGFFPVEGSEKTIVELAKGSPQDREIAKAIIDRIMLIYKAYEKAGLIKG